MSAPTIPAQCDTVAVLVNLTRWLMDNQGTTLEGSLYWAECILGIDASADPFNVRARARFTLQETLP